MEPLDHRTLALAGGNAYSFAAEEDSLDHATWADLTADRVRHRLEGRRAEDTRVGLLHLAAPFLLHAFVGMPCAPAQRLVPGRRRG